MRDWRAPIVIINPLMIVYFYNNIIYVCVYDTNYMTRLIENSHVLVKTIFIYFFTSLLPPPLYTTYARHYTVVIIIIVVIDGHGGTKHYCNNIMYQTRGKSYIIIINCIIIKYYNIYTTVFIMMGVYARYDVVAALSV